MKLVLPILILLLTTALNGQSFKKLDQLSQHLEVKPKVEGGGIQIHQFLDTCIYDHKCGEFTGGAFKEFGVIKGFMLTVDRRLRCNQMTRGQVLPIRLTREGFVKDHWNNYRVETQ